MKNLKVKVGNKYRIRYDGQWISDGTYEVIRAQSENDILIGFDKNSERDSYEIAGWTNSGLSSSTGYRFFWAIGKENLVINTGLEIE